MRELTEIKQELSNSEENEGDFIGSITSPNQFNSQIVIKQEESSTSEAEDIVHHNKMTSLTCQVKIEPESEEDGSELESTVWDYPALVIKRETIEVHTEDQHMMDDDVNQTNTTKVQDSGTEANRNIKSENDNWYPNSPNDNIGKQDMFELAEEMRKQQICARIGEETEISHTRPHQTEENHKCSACAKAFHSSQACLQHVWNTHTGENPYTYEVCGKSFKCLRIMQMHKAVHSDDRLYFCDLHKRTFKYTSDLYRHKVSCHSNERPYSCDMCEKSYKRKQHLDSHKKSVHSYERPYICEVCGKSFKYLRIMEMHKAVHSDDRPYFCDLCKRTFKYKSDLYRHKVSCQSNERPYFCDLCEKSYKRKEHLDSHKKTVHSDERPYTCDVCKKAFKYKNVLHNHKMSCHSNERPCSCDLCDRAFKCKSMLQKHKVSCHSDERPYSCNVCKKMFKQKAHLVTHKRTVHSDEKP